MDEYICPSCNGKLNSCVCAKCGLEFDKEYLKGWTTCLEKKVDLDCISSQTGKRNRRLEISDHALLRYIERVMLIDVASIRENITKHMNGIAPAKNAGRVFLTPNIYAVVKNNIILTIVDKDNY
jgi:hypothetical protein